MKKILLVFAVLFISVSCSFAFQERIYAGPPVNHAGTGVNINANCSYIKFNCLWSNSSNGDGSGGAVAYSDILIGEYSYTEGMNARSYNSPILFSRYWDFVQIVISAFNCYGEATLEWAL